MFYFKTLKQKVFSRAPEYDSNLGSGFTEARRGHGATQVANARLHITLTPY
jgi:hypothetical protein